MRIIRRCFAAAVFVTGVLATLATVPSPVSAQCGMMGGSGHDHSAMQGNKSAKPSGSDKKLRQSIDRVLSDQRGRALLSDALLNDRAFIESLIQRLSAIPEWRAMAARQLSSPELSGPTGAERRVAPNGEAVTYACPMHPDVTASSPGDCPKCGMALVRKESQHE